MAYSEDHPLIIGILLVKSLLCVQRNGQTIASLYKNGKIALKAPLYVDTEVHLSKVAHAFEEGQCHMGIVCDKRSDASSLRDFCDDVHT